MFRLDPASATCIEGASVVPIRWSEEVLVGDSAIVISRTACWLFGAVTVEYHASGAPATYNTNNGTASVRMYVQC